MKRGGVYFFVCALAVAVCGGCATQSAQQADDSSDELRTIKSVQVLETLQESLEHHESDLKACVEQLDIELGEIEPGEVRYELRADAEMNATDLVVVESTIDLPELEQCVRSHLLDSWGDEDAGQQKWKREFTIGFWPLVERDDCRVYFPRQQPGEDLACSVESVQSALTSLSEADDEEQAAVRERGWICDSEEVSQGMRDAADEVEECYRALLSGEMGDSPIRDSYLFAIITRFWLVSEAEPVAVIVPETTAEELPDVFEDCIVEHIGETEMTEPEGGICKINYPFVFVGYASSDEAENVVRLDIPVGGYLSQF